MSVESDHLAIVRDEYAEGRIDEAQMEAAIAHVLAGGLGNDEFPFLPMFTPGFTDTVGS